MAGEERPLPRVAAVSVSTELMHKFLKRINPFLRTAEPQECFEDKWQRCVVFVFSDPSFPEVPESCRIPELPNVVLFDERFVPDGRVACPLCDARGHVEKL